MQAIYCPYFPYQEDDTAAGSISGRNFFPKGADHGKANCIIAEPNAYQPYSNFLHYLLLVKLQKESNNQKLSDLI